MKQQEKAIKEIIKKYGENINLKNSPYLIAEIVRNYGAAFGNVAGGESGPVPGSHGTPPPPPPGPHGSPFEKMFTELQSQLVTLTNEVKTLQTKINDIKR